jgi:hypothetical protein
MTSSTALLRTASVAPIHALRRATGRSVEGAAPSTIGAVEALVRTVDRHGIDRLDAADIEVLAGAGRAAGLHPELVAALRDTSTPTVVRNRIVGRLTPVGPGRPAPGALDRLAA